ncbi:antitoxin, partial [Streptomyces albidoflavus]
MRSAEYACTATPCSAPRPPATWPPPRPPWGPP